MASVSDQSSTEYPSLVSANIFWEKAQEEYNSAIEINRKDGCEKAFRAATEAFDALLAFHGYFVPVSQSMAHLKRAEYILALRDVFPDAKRLGEMYSTFKDQLHGNCFYTAMDPENFKHVFNDVGEFLDLIVKVLSDA